MSEQHIDVHIRDTKTGEARVYRGATPWGEGSDYMWSEGNFRNCTLLGLTSSLCGSRLLPSGRR